MHRPYGYDFGHGTQQDNVSPYLPWGRPGKPPTASIVLDELDLIVFDERALKKYSKEECSVCCTPYKVGDEANKLPCLHLFHVDCLVPWLKTTNTCPLCRNELPTLDPAYEEKRNGRDNEEDDPNHGNYPSSSSSYGFSIYS